MRALRNIHAALVPGGLVVDTQPVGSQPRVLVDGVDVEGLDMSEWVHTVAAVDLRVAQTLENGLFEICHEERIVVADSFEDGTECLGAVAGWRDTRVAPALVNRLEAARGVVTVEQDVRLRLLRSQCREDSA